VEVFDPASTRDSILFSLSLSLSLSTEIFFIITLHGPRTKHSLSVVGKACLHCRWIFISAGISLPSRCLAMNVYSDFGIPAFGRHVTIFIAVTTKAILWSSTISCTQTTFVLHLLHDYPSLHTLISRMSHCTDYTKNCAISFSPNIVQFPEANCVFRTHSRWSNGKPIPVTGSAGP
jgi:hypothetical protein